MIYMTSEQYKRLPAYDLNWDDIPENERFVFSSSVFAIDYGRLFEGQIVEFRMCINNVIFAYEAEIRNRQDDRVLI